MSTNIQIPAVSFDELLRNRTHKARSVGAHIHIYNSTTGVTEFILKRDTTGVRTKLVPRTLNGATVLVEEELADGTVTVQSYTPYSEVTLELVCNEIINGRTLKEICSMPDMPSYVQLCSWKRNIPGVEEKLAQAREDRGEYLRDTAMEEVHTMDEDNVASSTARHKALVWAAGVDNARYSPKAKIEATLTAPTQIVVYTGIGVPNEVQPRAEQDKQVSERHNDGAAAGPSTTAQQDVLVNSVLCVPNEHAPSDDGVQCPLE